MSYLKRDRENVICHSIRMMRSDVFLSLKEATRSAVLDRVVKGEMTAAEGAALSFSAELRQSRGSAPPTAVSMLCGKGKEGRSMD